MPGKAWPSNLMDPSLMLGTKKIDMLGNAVELLCIELKALMNPS
jgi:hypothetical protein